MQAIGNGKITEAVIRELGQFNAPKDSLLARVDFGSDKSCDVRLKDEADTPWFRCYHAGALILIRNLRDQPLWIRGYQLDSDHLLLVRPSDEVIAGGWRLNYNDLIFFLQAEEKDIPSTLFLIEENEEFTLSRNNSRLALAKIAFGHRVYFTPFKKRMPHQRLTQPSHC